VPDDWKPDYSGRGRPGVKRTVRDRNGVPWHYDHNLKRWVEGMWTSKAALRPGKQRKEEGNGKKSG